MIHEQEFIIEINKENLNLIEEIIFQVPFIYNKAMNPNLINQIISQEKLIEKNKNEKTELFLQAITNVFMDILKFMNLVVSLNIKKIERKNISIQIKNNQIFLLLNKAEIDLSINNKKYKVSIKKIKILITFTEKGELIIKDFELSDFYINYFWIKLLVKTFLCFKKSFIIEQIQKYYFEAIEEFNGLLDEFNIKKIKIENNILKIECIKI